MLQEQEPHSSYIKIAEVFGLTDKEQLYDFISDTHFQAMLQSEETTIHQVTVDTNNYGEFLFVTISRSAAGKPRFMTFWGAGFHEKRERWLTQEWRFHESYIRQFPPPIPKQPCSKFSSDAMRLSAKLPTLLPPKERSYLRSWLI